MREAQTFIGLKNKSDRDRFESGSSAFLLNKEWLKKYKLYILYKDIKRNNKPPAPEVNIHPGPIDNEEQLCERDDPEKYLKGTGKVEQFPSDVLDKFVREDIRERYQFKVVNQELWEFLHSRYGGSTIRRVSIPLSQWSNQVEIRLKRVPIVVLPTHRLYQGGDALAGLEKDFLIQLPKKSKFIDVKKRIVDCINAANEKLIGKNLATPITDADIRLWKFSDQSAETLTNSCIKVSDSTDSQMTDA